MAGRNQKGGPEIDISAILSIVFALVILGGLVAWIAIVVRRASELNRQSDSRLASLEASVVDAPKTAVMFEDPLDAPAAGRVADPVDEAIDPLEAKLRRLDGLHARGVITDAELAAARASLLAE